MVEAAIAPSTSSTVSSTDTTKYAVENHSESQKLMQQIQIHSEIFRYKVVYPGGVCIRISPAIDAEKTGEVLEYGSIFQCNKSLVLDGVNYAKLTDYDGWVFDRVGDTEVLELLEVIRNHSSFLSPIKCSSSNGNGNGITDVTNDMYSPFMNSPVPSNGSYMNLFKSPEVFAKRAIALGNNHHTIMSKANQEKEKLFEGKRSQSRFWREVRSRCGDCSSFDEFITISCGISIQPPSVPESGPARSVWMMESSQDDQIRSNISIIASITRQITDIVDTHGLEASLWVLVHMGSRVIHIMNLAVESANTRFDTLSVNDQTELLGKLLEVASRTKHHSVELSKLVDILPDDIRNFLQRWMIIKSLYEEEQANIDVFLGSPTVVSPGDKGTSNNGDDNDSSEHDDNVTKTPYNQDETMNNSWFFNLICKQSPMAQRVINITARKIDFAGAGVGGGNNAMLFWESVERQLNKISDPDYQLAFL